MATLNAELRLAEEDTNSVSVTVQEKGGLHQSKGQGHAKREIKIQDNLPIRGWKTERWDLPLTEMGKPVLEAKWERRQIAGQTF